MSSREELSVWSQADNMFGGGGSLYLKSSPQISSV